jgi:4-diphosphocytidyl-2-C-methyl-D-erythritol kinase
MRRFRSFAKINLHLEVAGRRDDGYHELRTVFQTISVADEITVARRRAAGVELRVEGADLPSDARNLAFRAAARFLAERAPSAAGVAIELRKRIPAGGGLGGGSSNAATVLRALERLFRLPTDAEWLRRVGRDLGADVPFFFVGGTAIGRGRGDEIEPLVDAPAPRGVLVLMAPDFGLSTAAVFAALAPVPSRGAAAFAWPPQGADAGDFAGWIGENVLEDPAFRLRPELGALYTAAVRSGARRVRMSGSGSSLFALYASVGEAERASRSWPPEIAWTRFETLGRAAWNAASGFGGAEEGA